MQANPKIVILGEAKSGTTGLYFKIKNSISPNARCVFEPKGYQYHSEAGDNNRPVLAKVLFGNPKIFSYESFSSFDHKIFIVRDPRDRIISEMLFWVAESEMCQNNDRLNQYMKLLKQKEDSPQCISVFELVKQGRLLGGAKFDKVTWKNRIYERFGWIREFLRLNPEYFLLKYDDFISDNLTELEKYLGFQLLGEAKPVGFSEIVVRTKKSGDWKNWFLPEDVDYFRPAIDEFLSEYGFSIDWSLNENPIIDASYCTKYIKKTLKKRNCIADYQTEPS